GRVHPGAPGPTTARATWTARATKARTGTGTGMATKTAPTTPWPEPAPGTRPASRPAARPPAPARTSSTAPSTHVDEHLTDRPALDRVVRLGGLLQRVPVQGQPGLGTDPDRTRGDSGGHVLYRLQLRLRRHGVHEHELVPDVPLHQRPGGQREVGTGVAGHGTADAEHLGVERGVRRRGDLDHDVHPVRRHLADLRGRVAGTVVDH